MVDFATNAHLNFNRRHYNQGFLDEHTAETNPFDQFDIWLNEALTSDQFYANAMVLSTVDADSMPDSRVVLLRNISYGGLTFYTNYNSKKGRDIETNPSASALFFWKELERQVRIQGHLELLPAETSDNYFESRPFESKVGAIVSEQSAPIKNRKIIDLLFNNALKRFESSEVPRPENWGGYVLIPEKFEFWQGRNNRLHDRLQYKITTDKSHWEMQRLMP